MNNRLISKEEQEQQRRKDAIELIRSAMAPLGVKVAQITIEKFGDSVEATSSLYAHDAYVVRMVIVPIQWLYYRANPRSSAKYVGFKVMNIEGRDLHGSVLDIVRKAREMFIDAEFEYRMRQLHATRWSRRYRWLKEKWSAYWGSLF